jgi:hypothetical protein
MHILVAKNETDCYSSRISILWRRTSDGMNLPLVSCLAITASEPISTLLMRFRVLAIDLALVMYTSEESDAGFETVKTIAGLVVGKSRGPASKHWDQETLDGLEGGPVDYSRETLDGLKV